MQTHFYFLLKYLLCVCSTQLGHARACVFLLTSVSGFLANCPDSSLLSTFLPSWLHVCCYFLERRTNSIFFLLCNVVTRKFFMYYNLYPNKYSCLSFILKHSQDSNCDTFPGGLGGHVFRITDFIF